MKNYLNYQSSEYDCGPVSLINALRYLYEREEILPDVVKFIMLYCMDTYSETGEPCRHGTSAAAMNYIGCWLNQISNVRHFPIHCEFMSGEDVSVFPGGRIYRALEEGNVVVLRLFLGVAHYVLLTGASGDEVIFFDPYYEEPDSPEFDQEYLAEGIRFIDGQPKSANRAVSLERLNRLTREYYEMGEYSCREALILTRTDLKDLKK